MNRFIRLLFLLNLFFTVFSGLGQTNFSNAELLNQSVQKLYSKYNEQTGANSEIFNGKEYYRPPVSLTGFPFYYTDSLNDGILIYNNYLYPHCKIQYDLVKDELITRDFFGETSLKLIPQKVSGFFLFQHKFIFLNLPDSNKDIIPAGYYELNYELDNMELLSKHRKVFKQSLPGEEYNTQYVENVLYYIHYNGRYNLIKDRTDLLQLFQDKKEQIRNYLKDLSAKPDTNFEQKLIQIVKYYSELKK